MIGLVLVAQETATAAEGQGMLAGGMLEGDMLAGARWIVALLCGAIGLWMMLPVRHGTSRAVGGILGIVSAVLVLGSLLPQGISTASLLFWAMAGLTVGSAVATIMAHKPVYSAIWFAVVLLGTSGLLLINGAQLLGIATLAVYAGAIVVTFLFVLMLSQGEGQSFYDRISWGPIPAAMATFSGMSLVVVLSWSISSAGEEIQATHGDTAEAMALDVMTLDHVATLGRHMFTKNLLAVLVAGVLLLAALVGAISMAEHGNATTAALEATADTSPPGQTSDTVARSDNGSSGGNHV